MNEINYLSKYPESEDVRERDAVGNKDIVASTHCQDGQCLLLVQHAGRSQHKDQA